MNENKLNAKETMTDFFRHHGITSSFVNTEIGGKEKLYRLVLKSNKNNKMKLWFSKSSVRDKTNYHDEIYITVDENETFNEDDAYEFLMSYISDKEYDEILSSYDRNIESDIIASIPSFKSICEFKIKMDLMGISAR